MNKNLLIGILAVVIIIIAAVAYQATQQPPAPTQTTTNQPPATPTTPTPTPTPTQTTPTPLPTTPPTTPTPTTTPTTPSPTPMTTAPPPAQKVTIKIRHALNLEEEAVFKEIVALYTQSHPNVQVIFENKAPDLQTAVLAALAAPSPEDKFDLFIWAHDWIGLMVEAGVLKPVDNDVADVLPKFAVQIPQYKGRIYGLPFTAETVALICNKKME